MPLLRSRWEVRRLRRQFGLWFFFVMALGTLVFAGILAGHYLLGW